MRIPMISMIAAGALALGGCAYGGLGLGYGDGYGAYGYGSPYGYGYNGGYGGYGYNSGYYGSYGSPYGYAGYGYGYGNPYSGWYGNYYYPGTGYYVYDSYRRPVRWNDDQRRYWTQRIERARQSGTTVPTTPNWNGFNRPRTAGEIRGREVAQQRINGLRERVQQRREDRAERRVIRNSSDDDRTPTRRRPR